MNWQEICDNPYLRDLPFKLETDRWGHILMTPACNRHSLVQGAIQALLARHLEGGVAFPECSIQTSQGVKVADVVWASSEFLGRYGDANPYPEAPEIIVEVLSPSNSAAELDEKKDLYFAQGAHEVWLCDRDGVMRFFNSHAQLTRSERVPAFPSKVELPFL